MGEAAVGKDGFQLGPEQERAVVEQRVEQRLDAEPVAREEQHIPVPVPQREGEHAAEAIDAALAPGLPGMDDDLGIAARMEDMAERLQFGNQFLVVVDLAVEDDADRLVFVVKRLLAGRQIDDRQPPVPQAHAGLDVQPAFIRPAVEL